MKYSGYALLLMSILVCSSCYKESTTMVTVKAQSITGEPIEGAQVRLFAEPSENATGETEIIADYTKVTNSSGIVYFNLMNIYEPGQSGVGIFKVGGQFQNLMGEEIIEVIQEKNNYLSLVLQ